MLSEPSSPADGTAMEEPASFNAKDLADRETQVLSSYGCRKILRHILQRALFSLSWQGSERFVGYLEEAGISQDSTTEILAVGSRYHYPPRGRSAVLPAHRQTAGAKRVTEIAVNFKRATSAVRFHVNAGTWREHHTGAATTRHYPHGVRFQRYAGHCHGSARRGNMDFTPTATRFHWSFPKPMNA